MKLSIQLQALDSDAIQQFDLPFTGQPILLGRGPESPVPLDGVKLSRNHLALSVEGNQLTLTDLSSNGVWINAQSIPKKSPVPLQGSEEIAIPGYRLRVRLLLPPSVTAPTAAPPVSSLSSPTESNAPGSVGVKPIAIPTPATEVMVAVAQPGASANSSGDTLSDGDTSALVTDAGVGNDARWWRLSGVEQTVLLLAALSITLFAYYASIR
ncbi:MAG: FHA domain-containing protein [Bryobacterales bacterium]|nr:FHA domain-containing protein [Bryobacterales bacterium]